MAKHQKRPVVSWKKIVRMLIKLGYTSKRQKGSHMFFSIDNPQKGYGKISVPKHTELDPGMRDEIIASVSMHTGIPENALVDMLR